MHPFSIEKKWYKTKDKSLIKCCVVKIMGSNLFRDSESTIKSYLGNINGTDDFNLMETEIILLYLNCLWLLPLDYPQRML